MRLCVDIAFATMTYHTESTSVPMTVTPLSKELILGLFFKSKLSIGKLERNIMAHSRLESFKFKKE